MWCEIIRVTSDFISVYRNEDTHAPDLHQSVHVKYSHACWQIRSGV